ncbi:hypothetical protein N7376_23915, partial [Brucella intermedia GD04153]
VVSTVKPQNFLNRRSSEVHHHVPHNFLHHATKAGPGALRWHIASRISMLPRSGFHLNYLSCNNCLWHNGRRLVRALSIVSTASGEMLKSWRQYTTSGYSFQKEWLKPNYQSD